MRSQCGRAYNCYHCENGCGYWEKREQIEGGDRCCWGPVQVVLPATAENEGQGTQTCAYCRATRTVAIPKLEACTHTNRDSRVTREATCWQEGAAEEYCKDCGKVLNTWSIERTEHEWVEEGEEIPMLWIYPDNFASLRVAEKSGWTYLCAHIMDINCLNQLVVLYK